VLAQRIGLGFGGGILFGLDHGGLVHAVARGPAVPVVADAPDQAAVVAPLRERIFFVAARDLRQRAIAQVAHEHIAVAHEGHARMGRVVHRIRRIEVGAIGTIDAGRSRVASDRLLPRVADASAIALEHVLHALSVPGPPRILDRRSDPVGIGHHLLQRQGSRALRGGIGAEEQQRG